MKDFNRNDRVAEQLKRELSNLIRNESRDPRFASFTITAVRVTRDLIQAKIYLTSVNGEDESGPAVKAINKAANYFKHELKSRLLLRVIPQLHFVYDESIERASHMTTLIEETVANDVAKAQVESDVDNDSE
ncbi:MAG: ribosome-binding factor A [Gammaproteobacteria bacterium]|nr:MAG: ribosome-binding factor A [Gammaproteobacteria bacterium]PCH63641.1 MAG: ribosome-binding factor A [Gammaproteobacteria bacterium]